MDSVLHSCTPRPDLLAGTFNPEVFTASLGPVIEYYRTGKKSIDSIYLDADLFFREATYPTQGLKSVLSEVFLRIQGNTTVPAIQRLETAFGGGKTHTLISCTHLAFRGCEISQAVDGIIDPAILPAPGSVAVVGIAGDMIPVHKPMGQELVPYTLWGEMAYQIGGESLYREVETEAASHASPGSSYFEKVLGNRKVLIMLDELAQYGARLHAARPDGSSQLAAFIMSLHGYARNHTGVAIVLTLAGAADAFARQTEQLVRLLSKVQGQEVSTDQALDIAEKAIKGIASVVARDAVASTPVHAGEIASVLAKRLFSNIDRQTGRSTADQYTDMYRKNAASLPDEASSENYRERMAANYPFHPTLVDFLNRKLATAENFQGTRGVLRVLALVVRSLWLNHQAVPMIHACHLDMRADRIVTEILGRTGSASLLPILNSDVGSVDTKLLEGGKSTAQLADEANPHPEGYSLYEYTWKTVFLHSMVGQAEGIASKIFGLTESEALFNTSFPGMTPPQVRTALNAISEAAFYLRYEQGKYFAHPEATINSVLNRIRNTLRKEQIDELLQTTARKIIKNVTGPFQIQHDVVHPEHLPDGQGKPMLGIVSVLAESIDLLAMVTTKGPNRAREQQNLVFLLVPEVVTVLQDNQQLDFRNVLAAGNDIRQKLEGIARQVKAMRLLKEKPQNFGVNPKQLEDEDFQKRSAEREMALITSVANVYNSLYFPVAGGQIKRREIKTGGGESGAPIIEVIREALLEEGELTTSQHTTRSYLQSLSSLFFERGDIISLENLRNNFNCQRSWPVLESSSVLEQIIRAGVQQGMWLIYRMGAEDTTAPQELYSVETAVPLSIDLSEKGYSIVTVQGANQRGWTTERRLDLGKLREDIIYQTGQDETLTVGGLKNALHEKYGDVDPLQLTDAVATLIKSGKLYTCMTPPVENEKPELIYGTSAAFYTPKSTDILVTPAKASEKGWIATRKKEFRLAGSDGAAKFLPLLKRLGSLYNKGAKSTIDSLDIYDLQLSGGGTLRLQIENASPASMKALGELFDVLDSIAKKGTNSSVDLEITDPDETCPLLAELNKQKS